MAMRTGCPLAFLFLFWNLSLFKLTMRVSLHDPFPLSFSCLSHLSPCSSWGLCNPRLPAKVQQGRGGDHLRGRRSFYEEALLKGGLGLLSLFCHLPSFLGLLTLSLCLSCISWTHRASRPPRKTKPVRGKEWSGLRRVNARSLDGWRGLLVTLLKSRGRVPPCHLLSPFTWSFFTAVDRKKKRGKKFQNNLESPCKFLCFHLAAWIQDSNRFSEGANNWELSEKQ